MGFPFSANSSIPSSPFSAIQALLPLFPFLVPKLGQTSSGFSFWVFCKSMSFHEIHSWTLSGLIRAFLDLAFVYVLLCVSASVFVPSKILELVGFCLPCPCFCFRALFVTWPKGRIHSVLRLVKGMFPFDLILIHRQMGDSNTSLDGIPRLQSEACPSSLSGPRIRNSVDNDGKGKRTMYQRPRAKIRRRRRTSVDNVKLFMGICEGNESRKKEEFVPDDVNESNHMDLGERTWQGFESSSSVGKNNYMNKGSSSIVQGTGYAHESDINRQFLEQALEEEKAARVSLFLELEKERAAAATAADEAIAMITRLQNEKALVEMEARQYYRVIEEKFAYDEEEMSILREILVKKEIDYHVLEKEIEAYCQMDYFNCNSPIVHKIENAISLSRKAKLNATNNSQFHFNEEGLLKQTIWTDKDNVLTDCDFERSFLSDRALQESSEHIDHAVNDLGSSILDMEINVQDIHVIDEIEKPHVEDTKEGRKVDY